MDKIASAPVYTAANWVKYKEAYFFLKNEKNYPPIKAAHFIADAEGFNSEEKKQFYNATKSWERVKAS